MWTGSAAMQAESGGFSLHITEGGKNNHMKLVTDLVLWLVVSVGIQALRPVGDGFV